MPEFISVSIDAASGWNWSQLILVSDARSTRVWRGAQVVGGEWRGHMKHYTRNRAAKVCCCLPLPLTPTHSRTYDRRRGPVGMVELTRVCKQRAVHAPRAASLGHHLEHELMLWCRLCCSSVQ